MKNIFSKIICLLFAGLYIVSTMGYSVHHCNLEGTSDVEIMFLDDNICEHSHTGCDGHSHDCDHHNSNCCSTTVLIITSDQVVSSNEDSIDIPISYIPFVQPFIVEDFSIAHQDKRSLSAKYVGEDDAIVHQSVVISNRTLRV